MFADLRPYICTFSECKDELAQFTTRAAWADHEFTEHRILRMWRCPECSESLTSASNWEHHLREMHQRVFVGPQLHSAKNIAYETRSRPIEDEECPLCRIVLGKPRRAFIKHVGRHMEEIALMALPPSTAEDSDESSVSTDQKSLASENNSDPDLSLGVSVLAPAQKKTGSKGKPPLLAVALDSSPQNSLPEVRRGVSKDSTTENKQRVEELEEEEPEEEEPEEEQLFQEFNSEDSLFGGSADSLFGRDSSAFSLKNPATSPPQGHSPSTSTTGKDRHPNPHGEPDELSHDPHVLPLMRDIQSDALLDGRSPSQSGPHGYDRLRRLRRQSLTLNTDTKLPLPKEDSDSGASAPPLRRFMIPKSEVSPLNLPPLYRVEKLGDFKCEYAGCTAVPFPTQYLLK